MCSLCSLVNCISLVFHVRFYVLFNMLNSRKLLKLCYKNNEDKSISIARKNVKIDLLVSAKDYAY